jgi:hypothetical protein
MRKIQLPGKVGKGSLSGKLFRVAVATVKEEINPKSTRPSLRPEPFGSELKAELLRPRGASSEPQPNSSSRAEALNPKQYLNPNI